MANELADFDEQLDEIITEHKIKKSKEKRQLRKKEFKSQNIEKINSLKYEKLIGKSNQILQQQILKLFHEENFSDTIVECNKYFKYLHSCILLARVPVLFELLKKYFIVGSDTSLVPVFKSDSTNCSATNLNSLYNNQLENQLENQFNSEFEKQEEINPIFIHIRLPSELLKIFNLINFIERIYSDENIESEELELITILDKIKVLEDQKLFTLENYFKLDNLLSEPMIATLNDNEPELDCKMKVNNDELNCENEPLYININNKIKLEVKNLDNQENLNKNENLIQDNKEIKEDEESTQSIKNESIKKDKTFLLSKINLENEKFEINLLNDNEDITNKLANIDNEINEMRNQIDSADRLSSLDPENEEQQLITALSNEKIEINGLIKDELYGNIKQQKNTTDTVSDVSEICDEFSINSDVALKYSDSLNVKNLNLNDIELNFQENKDDDTMEEVKDKASLFHELINIENKVQKVVNDEIKNNRILIDNNQTYESYDNDLEEDKTLSGSMVRSGTFDLQLQIPINKLIETKILKQELIKGKLTESEDDSSLKIEPDSLMSNPNNLNSDDKNIDNFNKNKSSKEKSSKPSQNKTNTKMFQYFLDENQIIKKQKEINEMERSFTNTSKQSSGLFFIDLDDTRLNSRMSKSSTFDRKKSKLRSHLNESNESSSLNSSFIDDQNKEEIKNQFKNNKLKNEYDQNIDLLPMSMIIKKENINEKLSQSFIESNQSIFRLSNHYKTLSGTNLTNSTQRPNPTRTSSTLKSNLLKKTKSEIHQNTNVNQKTDDNEFIIRKSQYSNSKLGEDLIKLFINQINCDFTIYVSDKTQQLKAHKCILSARSEYFAKMFFDNLKCNHLNLNDFGFNSVHFILCHIYSGTINIPNFNDEERTKSFTNNNINSFNNIIYQEYTELNLVELLSLSDLFQLNILKDVILFEIKRNYCHHFHTPCNDCITGVINSLHLAQKSEIPSLYNPCINWMARHFKKIWPTKQFSTLFNQPLNSPRNTPTKNKFRNQPIHKNNEIIYNIYKTILDNLTNENVIDRILNLHQLASLMNRFKWNEIILLLIEELIEDCCKYLAKNYDEIVSNQTFIQMGKDKTWQLEILEKYLLKAIDMMKNEIACRTFIQLENIIMMCESVNENNNLNTNLDNLGIRLIKLKDGEDYPIYANTFNRNQFSEEFINTVQKLYKNIERYLIHNANEAVYCESWNQLSKQTQDHIKKTAVLVFEFEKPLAKRPVLSSSKSRQTSAEKQINSVKRKNMNSASSIVTTKKSNADDKSSDQSNQSTLTRKSGKELKNLKDKILKNNEELRQDKDAHIYDEVPIDLVQELVKEKIIPSVEYSKPIKKQQSKKVDNSCKSIAKVTPFSILPSDLSISNITTTNLLTDNYENYEELIDDNIENNYENIIYDETSNLQKVDSESSLASSCLAESENLQQELTKKVTQKGLKCSIKQSKQPQKNIQQQNSLSTAVTGSSQLHASLRSRNCQQSTSSANSNNSNNSNNSIVNSANSNRPTGKSTRTKKPPFK